MNDLLIVVPARGGSKRLPGKNLRSLAGKPLLAHTADAIAGAGLDAPVLLTTDDDAIAAEGERLGWHVPFRRPDALATDQATTVDAVLHALDRHTVEAGGAPAQVMVLQPTSPLRGSACLRAALDLLAARSDIDAVVGAVSLDLPAARLFYGRDEGIAEAVSSDPRHPVYAPNGALYLVRTATLQAARSFYTSGMLLLVMNRIRSVDIDTEADLQLAEAALAAGLPPETDIEPAHASVARNVP